MSVDHRTSAGTVPVIYSVGRQPELVHMASRLRETLGWQPVCWITQPELEEVVARAFPHAMRLDFSAINRSAFDERLRDVPAMDSTKLIGSGLLFRQALSVVSRHVLGRSMSADQQVDYLLERFAHASRIVNLHRPGRFVMNATPHSVADFCLYAACKLSGVSMRFVHLTGFRGIQVLLDDPQRLPLGLDRVGDAATLSAAGEAELAQLRDKQRDQTPWYLARQNDEDGKFARHDAEADRVVRAGLLEPGSTSFDRSVAQALDMREASGEQGAALATNSPFHRRFQPKHHEPMRRSFSIGSEGFSGPMPSWAQYYTYRDYAHLDKRRWKARYQRLTAGFDAGELERHPTAFFAMHYQPERTTVPEGGVFADQLETLRKLSQWLPYGWRLAVKEHPSQFKWQTEGELGRWDGYHEAIAALDKVCLVPLDVDGTALVDRCAVTVTVTGTVGWEAALRGRPAIALANPWFAGPGVVLHARDRDSFRQALRAVQNGWAPSDDAIRAHLAGIEAVGVRGFMNPSHAPLYEDLDEAKNAQALASLFEKVEALSVRERP